MWYVFLRKLNLLLRVPDRAARGACTEAVAPVPGPDARASA
jgi:hypothetical protein